MNLVKYCKASHATDAVEKGRIFVGTFSRYRKIERDVLRDEEEGAATTAVLDDEADLILSENDNESLLANSPLKLANGWKLELPRHMPLWLEKPAFNTFIFCVSDDPDPSVEKAARLGYDSFYRITDPFSFGQALMISISQHLGTKFGVDGRMGPVNYVPRKIQVVNCRRPSPPVNGFSNEDLFRKHERFSEDREFRFVFLEYSNAEQSLFNSFDSEGEIVENPEIAKWVTKDR